MQADPELQRFIAAEEQKQRFNQLVHGITNQCWDMCVGTPSSRMDKRTENCVVNCVERFIDTSNYVVQKLEKEGEKYIASNPESEFDLDSHVDASTSATQDTDKNAEGNKGGWWKWS